MSKKLTLETNFASEYEDFTMLMDGLTEGSKGYVYDNDDKAIYEVVCTVAAEDSEGDYDVADDALLDENPDADFSYAGEFVTDDYSIYVGLKVTDTYKEDVEKEDFDYVCKSYC